MDDIKERNQNYLDLIKEIYVKEADFKACDKETGELEVGFKTSFSKKITYLDVFLFSLISGDWNPLHHDEEIASTTRFGKRVVHGLLTSSLVSTLMERFPGLIVLLKASFKYTKPVYINDVINCEAVLIEKLGNGRYKTSVKLTNQNNKEVVTGECVILVWEM